MEKRIYEWSSYLETEREISRHENKSSDSETRPPQSKKEVNSWDCSTPTDKAKIQNGKINDWDSNSECQETMVEPFDNNEYIENDNWDSGSEKSKPKDITLKDKELSRLSFSTFNSYSFSNVDFNDVDKSILHDFIGNDFKPISKRPQDDALLIEDLDEFVKSGESPKEEESSPNESVNSFSIDSKKVRSKQSEGTPEDTTIWMIPNSERTQSGESISKLISNSDREKLENLKNYFDFCKKTKSLLDVQKSKSRQSARSSKSELLGSQKNSFNILPFEGSDLNTKLEIKPKSTNECISNSESFDRTGVFFTEYECRTMTMEKDSHEKMSSSSKTHIINSDEEILSNNFTPPSNETPLQNPVDRNANTTSEAEINKPSNSKVSSMDVISLPDMIGKNSLKERQDEDDNKISPEVPEVKDSKIQSARGTVISESWLLLDDRGQYQTITRSELSILLNGRSADAVLQGRKEHFIPNVTLNDTKSLKNSLSGMVTKESFQHILKKDDVGGEDERKKLIDLERKVENTLIYIQPGTNFTASIKIIPVETEMIHLWKRTRDVGSVLSSEADLLDQPQEPRENISHVILKPFINQNVPEVKESQPEPQPIDPLPLVPQQNSNSYYSRLLMETRTIVDNLTNSFRTIQKRLDGEVNRNLKLQEEVNKLRLIIQNYGEKYAEKNSREIVINSHSYQSYQNPSSSLISIKPPDNTDLKVKSVNDESEGSQKTNTVESRSESTTMEGIMCNTSQNTEQLNEIKSSKENEVITVNIYTIDSPTCISYDRQSQETYSVVQSNLKMIENKMKHLQQENETVTKQNVHLKRKLKEISLELEKYLAGTSDQGICIEEGKELESLRDQVCNLKLELETLKMSARNQEKDLIEENSIIRNEFTKTLFSLKDWSTVASEIFQKIGATKNKLQEIGITVDVNFEEDLIEDPKNFSNVLVCYLEQTVRLLITTKNENFLYEQTLKEGQKESNASKDISGLDQVISGYSELIDQCREGQITAETKNKVMEDYFQVIMEKASLMEEMKILKTENEILSQSQLEHHDKLKQTMIALQEKKNEVTALESSQKLSEDERNKMVEVLKIYEEEKKKLEENIFEKTKAVDDLIEEIRRKDLEITDWKEKLKAALTEVKNFEKTHRLKDELVNEIKAENEELLNSERVKDNQIEILKNEIQNLEMQGAQLDAELNSTKVLLNESQNYITHLEALVNQSQESLDKNKLKLKESNQIINRLKSENDMLDKQHQCDLKLYNRTNDKLESCTEKLIKANNKIKEWEGECEKIHKKYESLAGSEKEKSEALELLTKEYKTIIEENSVLREKIEILAKDKDELLKEQRDLINKHALLSKDVQKLQEKYRNVKTECNDRTDLIRYLELMLKENLVEYNNRIVCLEQSISRIVEKIMVCKNGMREKHVGVDSEIKELRHQLNITYQERKELENIVNDYYSQMKHMKNEIQERERRVDELHTKLSLERQKTLEYENGRKSFHVLEDPGSTENVKIEQLESQISMKDSELTECKKELQNCQANYENEKKKLELTIADLKSEIKRYQLRIEVMMKNLSNCNKSMNGLVTDKRNTYDSQIEALRKEIQEKNKKIAGLNETINKYESAVKLKESDLENTKKKNFYQEEELKNLQNQIAKLRDAILINDKTNEKQQKEKDEMAEKLFQSIKLIMEERSARQAIESLTAEKEKNYKNQIDQVKNELTSKVKEYEAVRRGLEDKNAHLRKLQNDLKKMKAEVISLRKQISEEKMRNIKENHREGEEQLLHTSSSSTHIKSQNISSERMQSCLKELKEIREVNLELRKTEGHYQAKIVRLEDEIRDARLLIKELQGDIKTERKSKKAFKKMILAAKMEIEKCLLSKQLMSVVAERITRHLDLSEIPSRELLSGFRLSDSSSSSKIGT